MSQESEGCAAKRGISAEREEESKKKIKLDGAAGGAEILASVGTGIDDGEGEESSEAVETPEAEPAKDPGTKV